MGLVRVSGGVNNRHVQGQSVFELVREVGLMMWLGLWVGKG